MPSYAFLPPPKAAFYYYGSDRTAPLLPPVDKLGFIGSAINPLLYDPLELRAANEEQRNLLKSYRVTPSQIDAFRKVLAHYEGTHNFANFTVGKSFSDDSCFRYILKVELDEEQLIHDGMEWLRVRIHGQSFIMHQIRKMIGQACYALVSICIQGLTNHNIQRWPFL